MINGMTQIKEPLPMVFFSFAEIKIGDEKSSTMNNGHLSSDNGTPASW